MKKLVVFMILLFMMAIAIDLSGANNPVDQFIDQHKNENGAFHMDMGTSFLSEDSESKDLISKVDNIRIFSLDKTDSDISKTEIKELKKRLKKKGYDTYMNVTDSDSKIDFFALEKKGKVSDWVMLVDGKESLFILEIMGDFQIEDVEKIGEKMDLKESKYMKKK